MEGIQSNLMYSMICHRSGALFTSIYLHFQLSTFLFNFFSQCLFYRDTQKRPKTLGVQKKMGTGEKRVVKKTIKKVVKRTKRAAGSAASTTTTSAAPAVRKGLLDGLIPAGGKAVVQNVKTVKSPSKSPTGSPAVVPRVARKSNSPISSPVVMPRVARKSRSKSKSKSKSRSPHLAAMPAPLKESTAVFPDDADITQQILQYRCERPVSILDVGHFPRADSMSLDSDRSSASDSDSDVEAPAIGSTTNRNVLNSFIEKKSEFYVEPEVVESTRGDMESVHTLLSEAKSEKPKPAPGIDPHGEDGLAPYMGFIEDDGDEGMEFNLQDLPVGERNPIWIGAHGADMVFKTSRLISLNWDILRFMQYHGISKANKKTARTLGKNSLAIVTQAIEDNWSALTYSDPTSTLPAADSSRASYSIEGELVGSLSTRLARNGSDVNICLFLKPEKKAAGKAPLLIDVAGLKDILKKTLEEAKEGEEDPKLKVANSAARSEGLRSFNDFGVYLRGEAAHGETLITPLTLSHLELGTKIVFFVNDVNRFTPKTADFISKKHNQYKEKLESLVLVTSELIRQRGMHGVPRTYEVALMAISFLNHKSAIGYSSKGDHSVAALFVDFLSYLTWRFNSYAVALNPHDLSGRSVKKESIQIAKNQHLHIIDPISGRNAAWKCYNWVAIREVLENALHMLTGLTDEVHDFVGTDIAAAGLAENAMNLHSAHPSALSRPTLLSRVILSSKLK